MISGHFVADIGENADIGGGNNPDARSRDGVTVTVTHWQAGRDEPSRLSHHMPSTVVTPTLPFMMETPGRLLRSEPPPRPVDVGDATRRRALSRHPRVRNRPTPPRRTMIYPTLPGPRDGRGRKALPGTPIFRIFSSFFGEHYLLNLDYLDHTQTT